MSVLEQTNPFSEPITYTFVEQIMHYSVLIFETDASVPTHSFSLVPIM